MFVKPHKTTKARLHYQIQSMAQSQLVGGFWGPVRRLFNHASTKMPNFRQEQHIVGHFIHSSRTLFHVMTYSLAPNICGFIVFNM